MLTQRFPQLDLMKFRLHWPPYWRCSHCGCTEYDCSQCVARTGKPCYWIAPRLCSACVPPPATA